MSPKLTVGLPNPSRKQRQRVRMTWTCACNPIKRIEALAWTNATTVRDAMKQILQHPKVIEAACCQTVPTTNTNSIKSISTIEDMCTALLDPDEAKSCISLLHSRSKPGKFGSRSDGAAKLGRNNQMALGKAVVTLVRKVSSAQKFKHGSDPNGMLGLLVGTFKHFKGLSADIGTLLDQVWQDLLTYHSPLVNNINSARSRVHWNDFVMTHCVLQQIIILTHQSIELFTSASRN